MTTPWIIAQQSTSGADVFGSLAGAARAAVSKLDILNRPNELLDALQSMSFVLAAVCVVVGILCVINGYRWHRWVIIVLAFGSGLAIGQVLKQQMGESDIVAISLGLLFAIIATPLEKISVAVFGGLTGAFVGANIWSAVGATPADTHWAGALLGFVIFALTTFLLYRFVIVMFTSVGGAAMALFGGITLLMHVEPWQQAVRQTLETNQLLLPLLLILAAVTGFVLQESQLRQENASKQN